MAVTDTDPGFDTLAWAQTLREAGVPRFREGRLRQAEAHAAAARNSQAGLATKADLNALRAELRADLNALRAELRADLYRALWVQTGAVAGTIVAAAGFVVAAVKLM